MKSNTKNFIEEDVGDLLELIDTGKNFLNSTPITLALRSTMGPESFCMAEETNTVPWRLSNFINHCQGYWLVSTTSL